MSNGDAGTDSKPLDPVPPFVWPDSRILSGQSFQQYPVFASLLGHARALLGVAYDVDDAGTRWFAELSSDLPNLDCRLALAVYPGCRTGKRQLAAMRDVQGSSDGHVQVRLALPGDRWFDPVTALCVVTADDEAFLVLGSLSNLGLSEPSAAEVSVIVPCEAALLRSFRNWFDWLWLNAVPLTAQAVDIPALVPATGDPAAAAVWRDYVRRCSAQPHKGNGAPVEVGVDDQTGDVTIKTAEGAPVASPTADLRLPALDPTTQEIDKLFRKGRLAAVDKATRVPPLDAPLKPELFGVDGLRKVGGISREERYRISVFDEVTLRKLEAKRKAISELLERFTFPMGDGIRWMPDGARAIFEEELNQANAEARTYVGKQIAGTVEDFVRSKREKIVTDANAMYQAVHGLSPDKRLPESTIDDIMNEITRRLDKAKGDRFLPKVGYSELRFKASVDSDWNSPYGQALALLHGVAEFPRRSFARPSSVRGFWVHGDRLFDAMDVCADDIVRASQAEGAWKVRDRAEQELSILERIMKADCDNRTKCEAILALMKGRASEAEAKIAVRNEEQTEQVQQAIDDAHVAL